MNGFIGGIKGPVTLFMDCTSEVDGNREGRGMWGFIRATKRQPYYCSGDHGGWFCYVIEDCHPTYSLMSHR